MAAIAHRDGADAAGARQLDRQSHRAVGNDLAKSAAAIDDGRGRGSLDHLHFLFGLQSPGIDQLDILRHAQHAVRIVPGQVGFDQVGGDERRMFTRAPDRSKIAVANRSSRWAWTVGIVEFFLV